MCYHRYMGLFDDLIDVAKELNDLKTELTSTVTSAASDVTRLRDDATAAVTQLKTESGVVTDQVRQRVIDAKNTTISDFKSATTPRQSR